MGCSSHQKGTRTAHSTFTRRHAVMLASRQLAPGRRNPISFRRRDCCMRSLREVSASFLECSRVDKESFITFAQPSVLMCRHTAALALQAVQVMHPSRDKPQSVVLCERGEKRGRVTFAVFRGVGSRGGKDRQRPMLKRYAIELVRTLARQNCRRKTRFVARSCSGLLEQSPPVRLARGAPRMQG
eukprot:6172217-Pleurochrysis_carterae.AAC.1